MALCLMIVPEIESKTGIPKSAQRMLLLEIHPSGTPPGDLQMLYSSPKVFGQQLFLKLFLVNIG